MNVDHTRKIIQAHGAIAGIHDLAYRAASRLVDLMVLNGMAITMAGLDRSYLGDDVLRWGFLGREELLERVRARPMEMTEAFVESATGIEDRCYGALLDGELVSYGWYSTQPTRVTGELTLHFDPSYVYMYSGFTLPEHRGRRLHGIGMARALAALTAEGHKGLVSYVRSNNFASLKSCYRMGYRDFGRVLAARANGRYLTYATPGCRAYDFRLVPTAAAASRERSTERE
jgi:hypothetical protein